MALARLKYWGKLLAERIEASLRGRKAAPLFPAHSLGRPEWTDRNFQNFVDEGYKKNAAIFACVQAVAIAGSTPPLTFTKWVGDEREPYLDHPMQGLLDKPNTLHSQTAWMRVMVTHYALDGNVYLHLWRNNAGEVVEMWPLRPDRVAPIPSAEIAVAGYEYKVNGHTTYIPPEDMIHIMYPSPDKLLVGVSPLTSAVRMANTDNEATDCMKALLENPALPGGTLETDATLDADVRDRLLTQFRERYSGDKRGMTPLLEGGIRYNPTMMTPKDLEMGPLRELTESRICAAFGVPAEIIGLYVGMLHKTYNNVAEAKAWFWDSTIYPLCTLFADELTRGLAAPLGDEFEIIFDLTETPGFLVQRIENREFAFKGIAAGILTRNEARTQMGLPPVDDKVGDVFLQTYSIMERPVSGNAPVEPEADIEDETKDAKAEESAAHINDIESTDNTGLRRRALIKRANRRLLEADKWRPMIERDMKAEFALELKEMKAAVRSSRKAIDGVLLNEKLTALGHTWEMRLQESFKGEFSEAMSEGLDSTLEEIGVEIPAAQRNVVLADAVQKQSLLSAANVNGTSIKQVRSVLATGIQEGWSERKMTGELTAKFDEFDRVRAKMIAHTESVNAYNAASQAGYKSIGVTTKEWLVTEDDVTCESCIQQGQKGPIGIDEIFQAAGSEVQWTVGDAERHLGITRDTQHPPLHPNCRCVIIPGPEEEIMVGG